MGIAMRLALAPLLACCLLSADPVIHNFEAWRAFTTHSERVAFFLGWTNGFFYGRGPGGLEFGTCLQTMTTEQALAMIDKYYKDHPERWSKTIGNQLLEALTVPGSPCEGKNVWK